jgi:putative membrane protein
MAFGPAMPARPWGPGREMVTMMFWYGGGWAWWQAGLMWVGMIAFWALLIWAVYALVKGIARRPEPPGGDDARSILDQRLARGEISPEEYQRLRGLIDPGTGRVTSGTAR